MGYVYLLCDGGKDSTFKIGVTRGDIEKRIKKLQTGNSGNIFLTSYFETEYPFFIEKSLHVRFFPCRQEGEWFELTTDDVIHFKDYCKQYEETAKALQDNPFCKDKLK